MDTPSIPPHAPVSGNAPGERFFEQMAALSPDAILVVDDEGVIQYLNAAAEELFGRPIDQMLGHSFGYPIDSQVPQEVTIFRPRAETRVAEMRVARLEWRGAVYRLATLRDLSDLVRLREELAHMVLLDDLTGLYNRRGLASLGQRHVELARRQNAPIMLLYIDLDDFKRINDTLGHNEGDVMLMAAAAILRKVFRTHSSDILARIGGDEFVVLSILSSGTDSAQIPLERLREHLADYNAIRKHPLPLAMSIGMVRGEPDGAVTLEDLLEHADAAMYKHKRDKRRASEKSGGSPQLFVQAPIPSRSPSG